MSRVSGWSTFDSEIAIQLINRLEELCTAEAGPLYAAALLCACAIDRDTAHDLVDAICDLAERGENVIQH